MCGLFGFIGNTTTNIDLQTLITLGIDNDIRGGDSCGLFIDGKVEYGIKEKKYFNNFYYESKLLKENKKAKIILGHCRKASVGVINEKTAQPIVIKNKETNEVDFVLIHNGTIINYIELAKKYLNTDEWSEEDTDSQIMAKIIYYHGTDVFKEYIGAGAFVYVDYRTPNRKPQVFMFHGKSKLYSYEKSELVEERPLYCIITKDGLWFSSIPTYLYVKNFCTKKEVKIYNLSYNCVINYDVNEKKLFILDKCEEREKLHQKDAMYGNGEKYYHPNSIYNYYEDYYGTMYYNSSNKSNTSNTQTELFSNQEIEIKNFKYYYNNKLADGLMYATPNGKVTLLDKTDVQTKKPFWFFGGILIYGKKVYEALCTVCDSYLQLSSHAALVSEWPELVYQFSSLPIENLNDLTYYYVYNTECILADGKYVPLLQKRPICYCFKNGTCYNSKFTSESKMNYQSFFHIVNKYDKMESEDIIQSIIQNL